MSFTQLIAQARLFRNKAEFLDHLSYLILIGTSILFIPFFGLSSTLDPALTPRFFAWSVMVFVLFLIKLWQVHKYPATMDLSILRRLIFPFFFGFLVFSISSLIKAENIGEGIHEVLRIILSILFLLITSVILLNNNKPIPTLIKASIVSALALSLIGIYQYYIIAYGKQGYTILYSIPGTMANKNQFSSALFLMLPFTIYGLFTLSNYWKPIAAVCTTVLLFLVLSLQTRSVWVGLFISTTLTTVIVAYNSKYFRDDKFKSSILRMILFPSIILMVVLSVSLFFSLRTHSLDSFLKRIESIYTPKSNQWRFLVWEKSMMMVKDNPVLGVGIGNWDIVLPSYGLDDLPKNVFNVQYPQRPHNDYLWVLSEVGFVGFLFYMAIFGVIIWYIVQIVKHNPDKKEKLLAILIFWGIVGYMSISFFTFPKERIFHSLLLLLMMALIVTMYHKSHSAVNQISKSGIPWMGASILTILLLISVNGYTRLHAEIHTKKALDARSNQNWENVISEIDHGYSVFAALDPTSTPLQWYRGEANFMLNNLQQALEDYKKAYDAHPYHIHVLNNLATCYELEGNHDEAINYYKQALLIFPQFEDALINLGAAYFNSGKYVDAYETLLQCNPDTKNPKLEQYLSIVRQKLNE
jgi:O-antigen ligase